MADRDWSDDFYKMSEELQEVATESVSEVLKEHADMVLESLRNKTPVDTGDLKSSLKLEDYKGKNTAKVGYVITYDGYDSHRRPYQVIANSLNRGYINPQGYIVAGTHFIDQSIALLRGMDDKINKRWEEKSRNINKN